MSMFLKQSTSITVKIGPFVDNSDGFTPETALTISQADIRLSKNGGDFAQTNDATGATHDENGYYDITLDTTDTNTLGRLRVAINETGALLVWHDFMVVSANVWDSFFGADKLQVDAVEISSDATAADNLELDYDGTGYNKSNSTIGTAAALTANNDKTGYALSSAGVQAIWDALTSALTTVGSIGKLLVDNVNATIGSRLATTGYTAPDNAGIAAIQAKTDNLPADPADDSDIDAQLAAIAAYIDTEVAAIKAKTDNLPAAPAATGDIPTAGSVADAVWDEAKAGHVAGGSFGEEVQAHALSTEVSALNDITVAEVLAGVIEGTYTVKQSMRLLLAALAGKSTGGGTVSVAFRDTGDSKDRIQATVDADGNRSAVTLDVTD